MPTITLTEFLARAEQLALVGGDARQNPVLDAGMTAEAIVPHALRYVAQQALKGPVQAQTLRTGVALTFTSGNATLPAATMLADEFSDLFDLHFNDSERDYDVSFLRHRFDRNAHTFPWMLYVWRTGVDTLRAEYGDNQPLESSSYPGGITLYAPVIPTVVSGNITANEDVLLSAIALTASVLRGDTPLALLLGLSPTK